MTERGKSPKEEPGPSHQPSSSSQAAQLLSLSGAGEASQGFIGFGTIHGAPAYIPISDALDDEDSNLDATLRMTLRKLTKKDSTTKVKALQELSQLCRELNEESVKAVLPYWPRIYNKLALDIDHKVREATQLAMSEIATRVRRNLAPHLKGLMGSWLLAQCDTYPTVSTAAQNAFTAAFPPVKQTHAIVFCKDEIANCLNNNLLNQTPSTLSDPKITASEDMDSKYQRVLASSFLAWQKLLQACVGGDRNSSSEIHIQESRHDGSRKANMVDDSVDSLHLSSNEKLTDSIKQLVENGKFWKHGKSPINSVRAGMYGFLASICQYCPDIAILYSNKLAPLVFHNLDESDTSVLPPLWTAVLYAVKTLQDCWKYVNVQKAFMPKLKSILQNSCHGNAVIIGPNLLPLLSRIPDDILGNKMKFYQDFFDSFRTGLVSDRVRSSQMECWSLVKAFMECAQYCVMTQLSSTTPDEQLLTLILIDQVLPVVQASILESHSALSKSSLNGMLGLLLQTISQSHINIKSLNQFCEKLQELITDSIMTLTDPSSHAYTIDRVVLLLRGLFYPDSLLKLKTDVKVKFASEKSEIVTQSREFIEMSDIPGNTLNIFRTTVTITLNLAQECMSVKHFMVFTEILTMCNNVNLVSSLIQESVRKNSAMELDVQIATDVDIILCFINGICFKAIRELDLNCDKSIQITSYVVEITLLLLVYVDKAECDVRLQTLGSICSRPRLFQLLLQKALIWKTRLPSLSTWLKSKDMGERLIMLANDVCTKSLVTMDPVDPQEAEAKWEILSSVLSCGDNEEPILTRELTEKILTVIHDSVLLFSKLSSPSRLETTVQFVCTVMQRFCCQLKGCLLVPAAEDLLSALFSLSIQMQPTMTEVTRSLLQDTWLCGVNALLQQRGGHITEKGFLQSACNSLKEAVPKTTKLDNLHLVTETAGKLLHAVQSYLQCVDSNSNVVMTLLQQLLLWPADFTLPLQLYEFSVISHKLPTISLLENNGLDGILTGHTNASVTSLQQHLHVCLYSGELLKFHIMKTTTEIGHNDTDKPAVNQISENKLRESHDHKKSSSTDVTKSNFDASSDELAIDVTLQLVYGLCSAREWLEFQRQNEPECTVCLELLNAHVAALIDQFNTTAKSQLIAKALDRSEQSGFFWSLTLSCVLDIVLKSSPTIVFQPPSFDDCYACLTEAKVHTIDALVPYLEVFHKSHLVDVMIARIVSSSEEMFMEINGLIGCLSVLCSLLSENSKPLIQQEKDLLSSVLLQLMTWRKDAEMLFLFNSNLCESSSATVAVNISMIRLVELVTCSKAVIATESYDLNSQWDFIMCSMSSWIQSIEESKTAISTSFTVQLFTAHCCHLLDSIANCILGRSLIPSTLCTEWDEFFSDAAYSVLLPLTINMINQHTPSSLQTTQGILLELLNRALCWCPKHHLVSDKLPMHLIAGQETGLPDGTQSVLNHLCPMLLMQDRAVQIMAYRLLYKLMPELAGLDAVSEPGACSSEKDNRDDVLRSPPESLLKILLESEVVVRSLLCDVEIEKYKTPCPHTDEYHWVMGYLLSWQLLLQYFQAVSAELRPQYAAYFQQHGLVTGLLDNIFRLIPDSPLLTVAASSGSSSGATVNMFEANPDLEIQGKMYDKETAHVACSVYGCSLRVIPAMVRQWWKDQDRKSTAYVDKFTRKHASPQLYSAELRQVQQNRNQLDNITVKARVATREVVATYAMEEVSIEMVITLPQNYPLGNIEVTSEKRVGVSAPQWEKWLLQLNVFLLHQNGSIIDGLKLWKRNIDKRFEGVEECMICFCVIHGTNFMLPRLQCKTCKKKYHSACLYKWFSTSHNCTCPICRNLF